MAKLIKRKAFCPFNLNNERYTTKIPIKKGIMLTVINASKIVNCGKYSVIIFVGIFCQMKEMP